MVGDPSSVMSLHRHLGGIDGCHRGDMCVTTVRDIGHILIIGCKKRRRPIKLLKRMLFAKQYKKMNTIQIQIDSNTVQQTIIIRVLMFVWFYFCLIRLISLIDTPSCMGGSETKLRAMMGGNWIYSFHYVSRAAF